MKRYAIIVSFVFSALCVFGQERHESHRCYEKYEVSRHHRPAYFVSGNEVFFQGQTVKGASALTFDILHDGYGEDYSNAYYCGVKSNGASSNTFKVLGYGYAKDDWNTYYWGQKIEN